MVHVRARTNPRGCPHKREPTPPYSKEHLFTQLDTLVTSFGTKKCFDLGDYGWIQIQHAVRGPDLCKLSAMVLMLLQVAPKGLLLYTDLKSIFIDLSHKYRSLVPDKQSTSSWASDLATRFMVVLAHVRRLKVSELRWRRAVSNCTEEEVATLLDLVGAMDDEEEVCNSTISTSNGPTSVSNVVLSTGSSSGENVKLFF